MAQQNTRLGIWLMVLTTFIFAMQDGLSRHLSEATNVYMVTMVRYWFFAVFVLTLAARSKGGLKAAAKSGQPFVQAFRGVLLVVEICVMVSAFVHLGLVESHAVFACYPDDATNIAELHVLADRALYAAKKAGKGIGTRYAPTLAA